jgi:hypothetical protein
LALERHRRLRFLHLRGRRCSAAFMVTAVQATKVTVVDSEMIDRE